MATKIITGASARLFINGKPYAKATSFSITIDYAVMEERGLDYPLPFELAPGMVSISGSISMERLAGDGGAQGAGLAVRPTDTSRQVYCSILLTERKGHFTIFRSDFCMANNETWQVGTKGRLTGSLSFKAIGFANDY